MRSWPVLGPSRAPELATRVRPVFTQVQAGLDDPAFIGWERHPRRPVPNRRRFFPDHYPLGSTMDRLKASSNTPLKGAARDQAIACNGLDQLRRDCPCHHGQLPQRRQQRCPSRCVKRARRRSIASVPSALASCGPMTLRCFAATRSTAAVSDDPSPEFRALAMGIVARNMNANRNSFAGPYRRFRRSWPRQRILDDFLQVYPRIDPLNPNRTSRGWIGTRLFPPARGKRPLHSLESATQRTGVNARRTALQWLERMGDCRVYIPVCPGPARGCCWWLRPRSSLLALLRTTTDAGRRAACPGQAVVGPQHEQIGVAAGLLTVVRLGRANQRQPGREA
ncbi:hypothetical protein FQR65_LT20125 [Abscondita terminalis]|nr:hypothetical protein FQR65_LT20125 [Abscondita terminalis]